MRVLIIECDRKISTFLAQGLEAEGLAVDVAENDREGLERAFRHTYDLLILDLSLQRLDGLAVLREINAQRPQLPVLILSSRSELAIKLRAFELGASDYLVKPFAFPELLARARALERAQRVARSHVIRVNGLVLDLAAHRARVGDRAVDLTDREFKLLRHLLEKAGQVVSRQQLLAHVWGYHFDPGSNVVEACVRRLRSKLGPDAPIETVRRAGYCFRCD